MTISIAVVIGHNRDKRGAVRVDNNETEYDFNGRVAKHMQEIADQIPGLSLKVFRREPGRGYSAEIRDVYNRVDKWGAKVAAELHFNAASSPQASGCETLSSGSSKSLVLAKAVNDAIVDEFGVRDRGIKTKRPSERGGGSLHSGRAPAILLEPYFGSNASDCKKFLGDDAERRLAGVVLTAMYESLGGNKVEAPIAIESIPNTPIETGITHERMTPAPSKHIIVDDHPANKHRDSMFQSRTIVNQIKQVLTTIGLSGAGVWQALQQQDQVVRYITIGGLVLAALYILHLSRGVILDRIIKWNKGIR